MSDSHPLDEEEALMRCWQESTIGGTDPKEFARNMAVHVDRFDRRIHWRNVVEYVAGLGLMIWAGHKALNGSASAMAMVMGVLFMMGYLYWSHRHQQPIDRATTARLYRSAMLARLDDQIRLQRRVKYWYLLPLYAPACLMILERWWGHPGRIVVGLGVMTSAFAFVAWLNESLGVRKLTEIRTRIAAFDGDDH
jgi:hypothetical protein